MRRFTITLLAASFAASVSAAVADTRAASTLSAGKPAGVKEATLLGPNALLLFLSTGIVIGGIALAVSNPGGGGVTTPTTTATSTTGAP